MNCLKLMFLMVLGQKVKDDWEIAYFKLVGEKMNWKGMDLEQKRIQIKINLKIARRKAKPKLLFLNLKTKK